MKAARYSQKLDLQMSASQGAKKTDVDADLGNLILSRQAGQGDGRLSEEDVKVIVAAFADGYDGKIEYGAKERPLYQLLAAATDDRNDVRLNGVKIRITDVGEKAFFAGMRSLWGKMGAAARAEKARMARAFLTRLVSSDQKNLGVWGSAPEL